MIFMQSQLQKEDALEPSKIDFGKLLLNRHQNLSLKTQKDIMLSQTGEQGELEVINEMRTFGKDHWQYFRNVWLDINGRFECDLVVLTNARPYVFEIKNYDGLFTYEDGDCTLKSYDMPENCIFQASRSYKKMRNLCRQANIRTDVKGAIVFVGKYNPVEIKSPVRNIDIVEKCRLKEYIESMVLEEKYCQNRQFDVDKLIQQFDKYGISDPFRFPPLDDEDMKHIKTGICCGICQNFNLEINKNYVKCHCGFHEPREEAMIRTICEYGVLRYDRYLEANELMIFLNNQSSRSYLYTILEKHFVKFKIGGRTFYRNKKLPYFLIHHQFEVDLPKTFRMDNEGFIHHLSNGGFTNSIQGLKENIIFHIR